jgi:hypothetical protein
LLPIRFPGFVVVHSAFAETVDSLPARCCAFVLFKLELKGIHFQRFACHFGLRQNQSFYSRLPHFRFVLAYKESSLLLPADPWFLSARLLVVN